MIEPDSPGHGDDSDSESELEIDDPGVEVDRAIYQEYAFDSPEVLALQQRYFDWYNVPFLRFSDNPNFYEARLEEVGMALEDADIAAVDDLRLAQIYADVAHRIAMIIQNDDFELSRAIFLYYYDILELRNRQMSNSFNTEQEQGNDDNDIRENDSDRAHSAEPDSDDPASQWERGFEEVYGSLWDDVLATRYRELADGFRSYPQPLYPLQHPPPASPEPEAFGPRWYRLPTGNSIPPIDELVESSEDDPEELERDDYMLHFSEYGWYRVNRRGDRFFGFLD